jgi:hypothetical protein
VLLRKAFKSILSHSGHSEFQHPIIPNNPTLLFALTRTPHHMIH